MGKAFRALFKADNAYMNSPATSHSSIPASSAKQDLLTPAHRSNPTVEYICADLSSFSFSLALTPAIAFIYVHWAEVKKLDFESYQKETELWQLGLGYPKRSRGGALVNPLQSLPENRSG